MSDAASTQQLTDINEPTTPSDRHSVPEALHSKYDSITVVSLVAALDNAADADCESQERGDTTQQPVGKESVLTAELRKWTGIIPFSFAYSPDSTQYISILL